VERTPKLTGMPDDRPVIGTIIKPSVGLSPEEVAEFVRTVAEAGVDFIKDDELLANPDYCPLEQRVELSMRTINKVAAKMGKKVMCVIAVGADLPIFVCVINSEFAITRLRARTKNMHSAIKR
jgi:ribulose-bisphosphate carboxylase large chain